MPKTVFTTHVSPEPGQDLFWGRHLVIIVEGEVTPRQRAALEKELQKRDVELLDDAPALAYFKQAVANAGFPLALVMLANPIQSQKV